METCFGGHEESADPMVLLACRPKQQLTGAQSAGLLAVVSFFWIMSMWYVRYSYDSHSLRSIDFGIALASHGQRSAIIVFSYVFCFSAYEIMRRRNEVICRASLRI